MSIKSKNMITYQLILQFNKLQFIPKGKEGIIDLIRNNDCFIDYFDIENDHQEDFVTEEMKHNFAIHSFINFYFESENEINIYGISKDEAIKEVIGYIENSIRIEIKSDGKDADVYCH
jgi:hypothetical protein